MVGRVAGIINEMESKQLGTRHARFGWRLVEKMSASLDPSAKNRLATYLDEVAFAHLIDHELAHIPLNAETHQNGESYGLCNGKDARSLFFATIDEVISPRLSQLGLAA